MPAINLRSLPAVIRRSWREAGTDAKMHYRAYERIRDALLSSGKRDFKGLRLLDIGCGERAQLALLFALDSAEVDGIDISPVVLGFRRPLMWIALARQGGLMRAARCLVHDVVHTVRYWQYLRTLAGRSLPFNRVRLHVGDALSLPFPNDAFNLVVSSAVWEHLPDVARATREVNRVLRPTGVAVIQIALFPSLQGGHHGEWHSIDPGVRRRIRPWDHLYPDRHPFPLYLNRWREADYRAVFARELDVIRWEDGPLEGEEYLTPRTRQELADYSERDLLLASMTVWASKK